jgi:hypothetical protein
MPPEQGLPPTRAALRVDLGRPDASELLAASRVAARSMGQPEADEAATRAFFEEILFEEDGRQLWGAFVQGLITSEELRDAALAYFATWLSDANSVREPSAEIWCTPEVGKAFDAALFRASRGALQAALVAAIRDASLRSRAGAVLFLEATASSVDELRRGESDAALHARLLGAFHMAAHLLSAQTFARAAWRGCQFLLAGSREELSALATELLQRLLARPDRACLEWRLVLTKLFPGDPERTLRCDPGYDLNGVRGSFVAWVEPYAGHDWRESQRYPSTEIVFSIGVGPRAR